MTKKLLTLEQLANFCAQNQVLSFNSQDSGYKLAVQVPANLQFDTNDENDFTKEGLLFTKVKVCHIGVNRNSSRISEENMKKAMPSLKYRPLLGYIHQLDDGTYDFHAHDMEIDEDGNYTYIESQIGEFTAEEPYLEYDADYDKMYVMAEAVISEDYTKAAEIIREKNGTKVSCELLIDNMQYDAKDKVLDLIDFRFSGVTCLGSEADGTPIEEGMQGSRLDILDFSEQNNSTTIQYDNKLIEALDRLNNTLSNFNIQGSTQEDSKEGGEGQMTKFEELLQKYEKTIEEISFEYEGLTDDELETAFAEAFGESDPEIDNNSDNDPEVHEGEGETSAFVKSFEISHDDIRFALYNLLVPYEEADGEWYFINSVYDDYFTYENYYGTKIFGQEYSRENDAIGFSGERYELFRELLTASEYTQLQNMRENYSVLEAKISEYEAKEIEAENVLKDEILTEECYAKLEEVEEFKDLCANKSQYSAKELEEKADALLGRFEKQLFTANKAKNASKRLYSTSEPTVQQPYGGLFKNK